MLGYVPGLLHAWYIIAKFPDSDYDSLPGEIESGRVTYVIVHSADGRQQRVPKNTVSGGNGRTQGRSGGYGTTAPMAPQAAPVHQDQNGTWSNSESATVQGGSSAAAVPPTYAEAVKGDHKIQTRD